jgi:hypothetical protein
MPTFDEELRDRIDGAAPRVRTKGDLFDGLALRKQRRATARKVGTIATVVVVLAATLGAFAILDAHRTGPQPVGEPTPTAPPVNFGLPYPICHISTLPAAIGSAQGLAVVFTKETNGCPKQIHDETFVGVDVDGNGVIDATAGPVPDCFTLCEAFAAPDVNGDGIAEIMVSTAGADGYGIWPYAVATSPPAIVPITQDGKPFGLAWVNVATHSEAAHCATSDAGRTIFVLDHAEWDASGATVIEESYALDGTAVAKLGQERSSVPIDQAPVPTDELCGVQVHGSAAGAMGGPPALEGRDIGLSRNVCETSRLGGLDLIPDNTPDVAFTGFFINDIGRCSEGRQEWIVAVDVTGDDRADAYTDAQLINCPNTGCQPLDATDLDADGDSELIIETNFSILDQGYFLVSVQGDRVAIEPILVAYPGHPEAGVQPGEPLMTSSGGDAGFAAWIRCESYPSAPVLVLLLADGVVDSNLPTKWHEVKFRLESDGVFHVIGSTDLSLPQSQDPGLIRSTAPACGVDFNPFV